MIKWRQQEFPLYKVGLVILGVVLVVSAAVAIPEFQLNVLAWLFLPLFILLVVSKPFVGLLLLAFTVPIEGVATFGGEVTFTRLLGFGVFGAWIFRKINEGDSWREIVESNNFMIILVLFGWMVISVVWAEYPGDVVSPLNRLVRLVMLAVLVIDLIITWERAELLMKAILVSGLVAAGLTLQQYIGGDLAGGRAGAGISGNLNNTAAILITIMPLAFYFMRAQDNKFWRFLGFVYFALSILAVAVTFSRAAFLVGFLILALEFRITFTGRLQRFWVLAAGISALIVFMIYVPVEDVVDRAQSIIPTIQNVVVDPGEVEIEQETGNLSIYSRGYLIRVGLRIFQDHPILGVGLNNFSRQYLDYQFVVPGADKIVTYLRSPHSLYLAFLVDLGMIGLGLWLALLIISWNQVSKAHILLKRMGATWKSELVRAAGYAFLSQVLIGFASTNQFEKLYWLIIGLCYAYFKLANQDHRRQSQAVELHEQAV